VLSGVLFALLAAVAAGVGLSIGLELLDRRVRDPEDLMQIPGVPVLGVLRPAGSRRPVFRRLLAGTPILSPPRPLLSAPGAQA